MKTIYKFNLHDTVEMQVGAKILDIKEQGGVTCVWALVDEDAPLEQRRFNMYGTGQEMPENPGTYLATIISGRLVWHYFEVTT